MSKMIIRILSALLLMPGFVFDVCFGLGFILNDGRTDNHTGDFIAIWAIEQTKHLPDCLNIPFVLTCWICALPAGVFCFGLVIFIIIAVVYVIGNIALGILALPFTGKFKWGNFI